MGKRKVLRLDLNKSVWKEEGGHSMKRGQTQKRLGKQQWNVWYKESGGRENRNRAESTEKAFSHSENMFVWL